jgi:hypothetical protein
MLFQTTLLTLTTILPIISASALHSSPNGDIVFNDYLSLDTIGAVPTIRGKYPFETLPPSYYHEGCYGWLEGSQVCGSYEENGVDALRAIYSCEAGKFNLKEVCHEKSRNNRCVMNQRGVMQWKKFYPFVSGQKVVCVNEKKLKMT